VIAIFAKTEIADICQNRDRWCDTIVLFIKPKVVIKDEILEDDK
jgi:hypothetical protein